MNFKIGDTFEYFDTSAMDYVEFRITDVRTNVLLVERTDGTLSNSVTGQYVVLKEMMEKNKFQYRIKRGYTPLPEDLFEI